MIHACHLCPWKPRLVIRFQVLSANPLPYLISWLKVLAVSFHGLLRREGPGVTMWEVLSLSRPYSNCCNYWVRDKGRHPLKKVTHFCGCDFRQKESFIKRWILAQYKPINSKLSEHNINPIIHQVATILPWVTGSSTLVSITLPNSTVKFCKCLKNNNFTSLAEIYCWT